MKMLNVCILLSFIIVVSSAIHEDRKVYIVYMGFLPEGEYSPSLHHQEILKSITSPRSASKALIRSYQRSFNGFAAYLSQEEKQNLTRVDGIVSVFPCQNLHLQTTRSWDFMGFPTTVERSLVGESNTIIGVIDTGIWPESESFNDEGLEPIPKKWKGECRGGINFTCNRKIIGARSYVIPNFARDMDGHGTHVASIIAGKQVNKANYYGLAEGIARGGVPSARLAVYKACFMSCASRDILSAFDDAISDGVDIISLSISAQSPTDLTTSGITSDPIAIGAFHAMQRGVLTVQAAGNLGPQLYTVTGDAPWIFTVAASSTNRRIVNKVLLGDGTILVGTSINGLPSSDKELPLVYGRQVTRTCSEIDASSCIERCLDRSLIQQKVVLCDDSGNADVVKAAGASGCILPNHEDNYPLPVGALNRKDIHLLKSYRNSTKEPKVQILKSQDINNPTAPLPDVTAPGVEILAAFSPMGSPSDTFIDNSSVKYTILSGTSMACPHVSAAAAFVKSYHPNWSPSAIKSALMTTAWEMSPGNSLDSEFAFGSGHINPQKAIDPGLVYDTPIDDYHKIWCNISQSVNASCHANLALTQLNYPSMAAQVAMKSVFVVSFPRTVTNVGTANSTYVAFVNGGSKHVHIRVDPKNLHFTTLNEKKSFVVTVRGKGFNIPLAGRRMSLLWTDGDHKVRSPLVVYAGNTTSTGGVSTLLKFCKTSVVLFVIVIVAHCINIL